MDLIVRVRVDVNVGRLRRGQEFDTVLTPEMQARVSAGYVRILGHVTASVVAPQPAPAVRTADMGLVPDWEETSDGGRLADHG